MVECYIGIGSNLRDRKKNISKSIELIGEEEKIISVSSLIETKPMYYLNQESFLNGVIIIDTKKSPRELLDSLHKIEQIMKRRRILKNGPRIIDLDIIFYGNEIIKEDSLIIPHPLMQERGFVLLPLFELNQNFVHPVINKSIKELLKDLNSRT